MFSKQAQINRLLDPGYFRNNPSLSLLSYWMQCLKQSKSDPVPHGCPISYLCPLETSRDHMTPESPVLPLPWNQHTVFNLDFVPTLHQHFCLQSLQVLLQMARNENGTGNSQSGLCNAVTSTTVNCQLLSRGICLLGIVDSEASAKAFAAKMKRGSSKQTVAKMQGLQMEPEVLASYSEWTTACLICHSPWNSPSWGQSWC